MDGQVNGIKETIYQIFDIVFPADLGNVSLGINEYQEIAESFRKLVDVAVDEQDQVVRTYLGEQIEGADSLISELRTQLIEKDAQLQEALRKEQNANNQLERVQEENTDWLQRVTQLEVQNESLAERNVNQHNQLAELHDLLQSKEEQIAKLTEEINKPKANIVIPSQGKSTNLQQLMEAARNKPVKSQMDLALSGQTFRGKVELAIPPSYGGNEETESRFQDEGIKTIFEDNWIPNTEIPIVEEVTPSQTETEIELGMDADQVVRSDDGPATWGELKALEARIEERIRGIELQTGIVV